MMEKAYIKHTEDRGDGTSASTISLQLIPHEFSHFSLFPSFHSSPSPIFSFFFPLERPTEHISVCGSPNQPPRSCLYAVSRRKVCLPGLQRVQEVLHSSYGCKQNIRCFKITSTGNTLLLNIVVPQKTHKQEARGGQDDRFSIAAPLNVFCAYRVSCGPTNEQSVDSPAINLALAHREAKRRPLFSDLLL